MEDAVWERLEDQIGWYEARSSRNRRDFKILKTLEIAVAAAIPIVLGLDAPRVVPALLGGLVLMVEAVLHLNQYGQNWRTYRATTEALKDEKFLYLSKAAHYAAVPDPRALLAERVETLISREHVKWVSATGEANAAHLRTPAP